MPESPADPGQLDAGNRLLLLCMHVPPTPTAIAYVEDNLSRQFSPGEMVLASVTNSGTATYQRDPALPKIEYVGSEWTWPQRGKRWIHWVRWLTTPFLVRKLGRLLRRERCNGLMVVFPNEFYLYAAYRAARKYGVRLYPHFHNTYLDQRHGLKLRFARWLQPRVFARAGIVFTMSEGMREYYEQAYPGPQFEPLVHTFNGEIPQFEPLPPPQSPLRLGFMGNFNDSNVDAMRRFAEVVRSVPDWLLTIISGTPAWAFAKRGVEGPNVVHDTASDDELQAKLRLNDLLLLPHGLSGSMTQVEYDTIFPTRTIPYLISGRPIVAHTPTNCFLTRWIRERDCAEIIDVADPDRLRQAIADLAANPARREQLVRNALAASREFHAPAVAGKLKRLLNADLKKGVRNL